MRLLIQDPPAHLPQPDFSDNARRVMAELYLIQNEDGEVIETPAQALWRVARGAAQAERTYCPVRDSAAQKGHFGKFCIDEQKQAEAFYTLMATRRFLPNSPTLMNLGANDLALSGCYVLPLDDSLVGIGDAVKWGMMVHASGGGTGYALSRLRPAGARVKTTQGIASGPVSFLRILNEATEQIKQGGKRRGANMAVLRVDHPDILQFIDCKREGGFSNFNISVGITTKFMEALQGRGDGQTNDHESLPGTPAGNYSYNLVDPNTGKVTMTLWAPWVWEHIAEAAWATGDPGLVFLDRMNQSTANPVPDLEEYRIETTNPCGEQPLAPFDACNLGSINLGMFTGEGPHSIDWQALQDTVYTAVRFLDDVIDVNPYPLPQIKERVRELRRIGLGVMGWADLLFKLRIPYDSQEAVNLAGKVMKFINEQARQASEQLARQRGAFPLQPQSRWATTFPIRNSAITTIAPTGTIGIVAGASGGIEPVFKLAFRHVVGDRSMPFVNAEFEKALHDVRVIGDRDIQALLNHIAQTGSCQNLALPGNIEAVFKTAYDIAPEWHIKMQAAFQAYTDNGVSKTINLPGETTVEQVQKAYQMAWDTGCMGITVFRDGSKGGASVLKPMTDPASETGRMAEEAIEKMTPEQTDQIASQYGQSIMADPSKWPHWSTNGPAYHTQERRRPAVLPGRTYREETPLGTAFITITSDDDGPIEVFVNQGKAGSETAAAAEVMGRLMSLVLRQPGPVAPIERLMHLAAQTRGIGGDRPVWHDGGRTLSLPDAIGQALEDEIATQEGYSPEELGDAAEFERNCSMAQAVQESARTGNIAPLEDWLNSDAVAPKVQRVLDKQDQVMRAKRERQEQKLAQSFRGLAVQQGIMTPEDTQEMTVTVDWEEVEARKEKAEMYRRDALGQWDYPESVPEPEGSDHVGRTVYAPPTPTGLVDKYPTAVTDPSMLPRRPQRSAPPAAQACPVCGHATFVRTEGCMTCQNPACGHSEC